MDKTMIWEARPEPRDGFDLNIENQYHEMNALFTDLDDRDWLEQQRRDEHVAPKRLQEVEGHEPTWHKLDIEFFDD